MPKKVLIDASYRRNVRVAVLDSNNELDHFDFELSDKSKSNIKGNIYLAKVVRIENSLQAVFVDYGAEKNGFLSLSEIHPEYFQISPEEKAKLAEEVASKSNKFEEDNVDGNFDSESSSESPSSSFSQESSGNSMPIYMRYNATEVIRNGQVLLVQVSKEERGNKGATMTSYISLAGRFFVLMHDGKGHIFVSKRIGDYNEKQRIKKIVDSIGIASNFSAVVRTAASSRQKEDFVKDYAYLASIWNNIREKTISSKAPAFIHKEDSIIRKTIREYTDASVDEVIIEGKEAYNETASFCEMLGYNRDFRVTRYQARYGLFEKFGVEKKLTALLDARVELKSGMSLVINQTEALVSVDVNSGKSNTEGNIEDMALKTNLEVCKEIARQLRLRNLSGIVVIDFIDMAKMGSRRLVEREMKDAMSADKARIQLSSINSFGLLIMSRQRTYQSFFEVSGVKCERCSGDGFVKSAEYLAMHVLRSLSCYLSNTKLRQNGLVSVYVVERVLVHILNFKKSFVSFLEEKHYIRLAFHMDKSGKEDSFKIDNNTSIGSSATRYIFDSIDDIDNFDDSLPKPNRSPKARHSNNQVKYSSKKPTGNMNKGVLSKFKSLFGRG